MKKINFILIGGGIMSATLGVFLKELDPSFSIEIFERLDKVALESSNVFNNAGTGHSAFCEINYTPLLPDGTIAIEKAVSVAEAFEVSKQFWAFLVKKKCITSPQSFIRSVPHISWGRGQNNVDYLKKRFEALRKNTLFKDMEFTQDMKKLKEWIPLMMHGRNSGEEVAGTRVTLGTDVNFGALTTDMFTFLKKSSHITLHTFHEVTDMKRFGQKGWLVYVKDRKTQEEELYQADVVFIGAGGGALSLLQKSGIPESKKYGGFPVNGNFLLCTNKEIINQHTAKVYGIPSVNTPPMSVPHLDTRIIHGEKQLLFGPFAGFSAKFLKNGSYTDLPRSLHLLNILPVIDAGIKNIPLTTYLIGQLLLTPSQRLKILKEFIPQAKLTNWKLYTAGQRVQIIKYIPGKGGVLQFGTEVITSSDGTLSALLGASPGASTSVSIMLEVLKKCFPKQFATSFWQTKLKEMIPSLGKSLSEDNGLCKEIREYTNTTLQLTRMSVPKV